MIGKILGGIAWLVVYTCVATVLATVILLVYLAQTWQVDRDKLVQMLAVAQGVDLQALHDPGRGERPEPSTEQPSYAQVLETRAVKVRDLELREQALHAGVQQLQVEQKKLADERDRLAQLKAGFQTELAALQKGAAAGGKEDVRRTLETIKPKQAKELLAQMLEKKEIDEVVTLLAGMSDAKRAKIIAEFKTPSEVEQMGEILRRIRLGIPVAAKAGQVEKQIEPPKGQGT